jgi:hypothetical protein
MAGELARARGDINISGLESWKIKIAADTAYYNLATNYGRAGKVSVKALTGGKKDFFGRNRSVSYQLAASAQFPVVKTKANMLALLTALSNNDIEHKIKMRDGTYFNSAATSLPGYLGTKWSLVSDKSLDDCMYLEVMASRKFTEAERILLEASGSSNPVDGSPTTETFSPLSSMTLVDVAPAGLRTITLGAGVDTVGVVQNGTFKAELNTTMDDDGCETSDGGVTVTIDLEAKQTATAERARWNALAFLQNAVVVTFASGNTFTHASGLGLEWDLQHNNDSDKSSIIKVQATGILTVADFVTALG